MSHFVGRIVTEYHALDALGRSGTQPVVGVFEDYPIWHWNILSPSGEAMGRLPYQASARYYHKDLLGSTRAVVTESGNVSEARTYDAWGVLLEGRDTNAASETHEGYTGKERDEESITGANAGVGALAGLDYFGARTYAPAFARFLQVDPLMEKHPDFSPYNYVLNNPLALVDPDGRQQVATTGPSLPLANVMLPRIEPFWTATRRTNEQAAIQRLRDEGQGFRATLRQGLNYLSRAGDASGQGINAMNRSGGLIALPGPSAITGPAKLGASVVANLFDDGARATRQILPDVVLSGGRSGQNVRNLVGPANAAVRGGGQRAFITDDAGRVILDITRERVKPVIPGQGFGPKRGPSEEELSILHQILGGGS